MRRREFIALAPLNRAGVLALAGAIYPSRSNAHHADGHDARGGKREKRRSAYVLQNEANCFSRSGSGDRRRAYRNIVL